MTPGDDQSDSGRPRRSAARRPGAGPRRPEPGGRAGGERRGGGSDQRRRDDRSDSRRDDRSDSRGRPAGRGTDGGASRSTGSRSTGSRSTGGYRAEGARSDGSRSDGYTPREGDGDRDDRYRGRGRGDTTSDDRRREGRDDRRPDGRGPQRRPRDEAEEPRRIPPGLARRDNEPEAPEDLDERLLPRPVRAELRGLPKELARTVGAHLLAAGMLIDSDPQLAYAHAEAARRRAARLPVVREAAAEAAYAAGEFSAALTEYRALRRMTGSVEYLAVIADCERALGRPEAALRLLRERPLADVDDDVRIEMLLVEAGAREDLGQTDEAWRLLKQAVDNAPGSAVARARMQHGFAELLLRGGDEAGARRWLASAARLDEEGVVGSADRIAELDGMVIEVDEDEFLDADPGSSDVAHESASADASTRGE